MHTLDIIALRHNDTSIAFNTTAKMWSLTDLWRAAGSPRGKEVWRWTETDQAKEYLQSLSSNLVLDEVCVMITQQGNGGGTWAHQLAGLEYARYLSPELSIACNQFILDYWNSTRQSTTPAWDTLEQRVAALERSRQQSETLTITISLAAKERISVMRDLGGTVTPGQLFEELRRRGQTVNYSSLLQWLHRSAKRGIIRKPHQGQYELKEKHKHED